MVRKTVAVLLLCLLTLLCACGGSNNDKEAESSVSSQPSSSSNVSSDVAISNTSSTTASNSVASNSSTVSSSVISSSVVSGSVISSSVSSENTSSKEDTMYDWKKHPEDYKLIALTFDDAPSHSTTTNNSTVTIVQTLKKYEGAGTLFVVGQTLASKGPALLQYAVNNGFELGNHTYEHRSVSTDAVGKTWTAEQNKADFKKCQDLVYQQLGVTMKWLRPSGVHTNTAVFQACAELGLPCIIRDTTVATNDWNSATTQEQIESAVINNAYDGAIVLMHSPNAKTAAALEKICSTLYAQGYRFCTLSELFELRGVDYDNIPYYKGINGYNQEQGFIYAN